MFGDVPEGTRLLVVEDERNLAAGLKLNFELEGFMVQVARTARDAAARVLDFTPHLILLDVMLPDSDGFSFCRRLRDSGNFTPVLMLTARGSTDDRILGLEAGADDYLTKPFEFSELLARVKSMMRRQEWARAPEDIARDTAHFTFGDVEVDFDAHEVRRAGEELKLTRLELDLLLVR